jgi:D-glycero-D-manno-heptose 1,7-bisphosphate phosphatase
MSALPAVFLDRDGTIVDDPGFLRDPADVRLLPGAAAALARFNQAGLAVIVVTNQSGIGRGLLTDEEYHLVEARIEELLAEDGATLDATYYCPHSPDDEAPCDCRKPGTRLYRRAADDWGIDLQASWWVGDRISDLDPARVFDARAVLVETGFGITHKGVALERDIAVVQDVGQAADLILGSGPVSGD